MYAQQNRFKDWYTRITISSILHLSINAIFSHSVISPLNEMGQYNCHTYTYISLPIHDTLFNCSLIF